jgi:hypothetical protein
MWNNIIKNKLTGFVFIVTSIGALITLINYIRPVIDYTSNLNSLVRQYESINESMLKIESHIKEYEEERDRKLKTFSIGLRSDSESGQIIYVDENNGIYRAFIDERTKEYFYYDINGDPIFCYTKRPVRYEEPHLEIRPLILPDTIILNQNN